MSGRLLRRLATLVGVLLLLATSVARARERGGVELPDRVSAHGKTLVLNGMGIREATVLSIDVYVAGLYLETRSKDPKAILRSSQIKQLVLRFVRDVDREDITDAWEEGFRKNAGKQLQKFRSRIAELNAWMTDAKDGGTMTFTLVPGKGVEVVTGGKLRGTVAGDDFAAVFLAIWLGPDPPNRGLKEGLLGK